MNPSTIGALYSISCREYSYNINTMESRTNPAGNDEGKELGNGEGVARGADSRMTREREEIAVRNRNSLTQRSRLVAT